MINEFSEVAGYKINIQKLVAFLCTNYQKEKLRKQCHLQLHTKYLEINLIKEVKDLYLENSKTLKKDIEADTHTRKHIACSWMGTINIVKNAHTTQSDTESVQWHFSQNWNK